MTKVPCVTSGSAAVGQILGLLLLLLLWLHCCGPVVLGEDPPLFLSATLADSRLTSVAVSDRVRLNDVQVAAPLGGGTIKFVAASTDDPAHFLVTGQQVGMSTHRRCSSRPRRTCAGRGRSRRVRSASCNCS